MPPYLIFGSALMTSGPILYLGEMIMVLSIQDLLYLNDLPTEEQVTLQLLADFYEEHICRQIFHYIIRDKRRNIRLRFRTIDLPHLLGIHKMKTGSTYRGRKGFPELKNGNLTLEVLKKASLGGYESTIYRILYFPFLYQLIHHPKFMIFNPQVAGSMIDAEFMLFNQYSGRYLHLGIKKEDSTDFYVPVTFLERKNVYPGMKMIPVDDLIISPEQSA